MAWPHLAGMIKVVVTYGFDGKPAINVHFVLQDTPVTPVPDADLLAVANVFHDGLDGLWDPEMGDQWTVDNITATDWSDIDGAQIAADQAFPITGTEVSEEVPASVCLVVSHRTDHTGRSRRGRTYLAGLTEGNVGGNNVDAGAVTAAEDYFDAIDTNLAFVNMAHVVYSLYSGGAERVTPLATPITSRIINSRVDTQRRRLPV